MAKVTQIPAGASSESPPVGTGFIRQKTLLQEYVPFSAATLWRLVNAGKFPRPVRLATQVIAWRVADVLAWAKEPQTFGSTRISRTNLPADPKRDPSNPTRDFGERS
jgi:prophage regulatory protein